MDVDDYTEEGSFTLVLDGCRYRIPAHCPHRAGRLAHGHINQARMTITCPLHHSVFSLESGVQLAGPACGALSVRSQPLSSSDSAGDVPFNHDYAREE
ncbi:Rieske (2Fe-2S) protein [Achromobacter pestifer]|uniref:Rieske domain-containing protein n=1 Tax=Achromobacter pestifer TaxID=1353889 RepID=A0A6S6YY55_9BURK|nr:Rieske 2Fe-2S domain-containing protein [Achromobacter pestifer]CAB3647958.1 hypothetical protein LMG3431_02615 [Achromobacter pestifer]